MSGEIRTGGCLCGAVKYRVDRTPLAVAVCHCLNCQKQSGSILSLVVVFPRESLVVKGALKTYEDIGTSGQPVFRRFCPECGSPLLTDTPQARQNAIIFVKGGSLDEHDDLVPTTHYWSRRKHGWIEFPSSVEMLDME